MQILYLSFIDQQVLKVMKELQLLKVEYNPNLFDLTLLASLLWTKFLSIFLKIWFPYIVDFLCLSYLSTELSLR